jgi:hypothetical protein
MCLRTLEYGWQEDSGYRLQADTFIFADAPAVQRAARVAGYDCIVYSDVFEGGRHASEVLLGVDVEELPGIDLDEDLEDDLVVVHDTYRPLVPVERLWMLPAQQALALFHRGVTPA